MYKATSSGVKTYKKLEFGKNYFHNDRHNKTETVILENLENYDGNRAFRIIHTTLLEVTPTFSNSLPSVRIKIFTKFEKKNNLNSDYVNFYLTSLDNSPGFYADLWKDGKQYLNSLRKNTYVKCNIQSQMTKYLEQTHKCQKESFYECIASQIDASEFNKCSYKCIPDVFSNMGKNYKTPFCQNDNHNQQCIFGKPC